MTDDEEWDKTDWIGDNEEKYEYSMSAEEAQLESMGVKWAPVPESTLRRSHGYAEPTSPSVTDEPFIYRSVSVVGTRVHIAEPVKEERVHGKDGYCVMCNSSPCKVDPEPTPVKPPLVIALKKPSWIQRAIDWLFARA